MDLLQSHHKIKKRITVVIEFLLPLPGSAQCNGINLAIKSKEQSIL